MLVRSKQVVEVLSRGGICERASIDEVYLDITEAAAARLIKGLPSLGTLSEEARKTHILGLEEVSTKLCLHLYTVMG